MKKILSMLLTLVMMLSLCACGAEENAPAASAPETPAVPVTEAPTEAPEEPVTELLVHEFYQAGVEEDSLHYALYLDLYPISGLCNFSTSKGNTTIPIFTGTYTEEEGLLTLDDGKAQLQLRREGDALVLEKGSLTAYCGNVRTEDGTFTNYEGEPLTMEMGSGTVFPFPSLSYLRDGIYVMDPSEYETEFDEVLIDIDLTNMTFALKCFDGYVVTGPLEIENSHRGSALICRYDGGALAFYAYDMWVRNEDGAEEVTTVLSSTSTDAIPKGQLMYCPPGGGNYLDKFILDPERTDEIAADPDVESLNTRKETVKQMYTFHRPVVEGDYSDQYSLNLYHYPLAGIWKIQRNSSSTQAEATENPDGSVTLSLDGSSWNFHWENDCLIFDGGDPLIVPNYYSEGQPRKEMELEVGTVLNPSDFSYLYDTLYIIPTWNGGYESALRIDRENQRLVFLCADGSRMESPYYWEDDAICCVTADSTMRIYPRGHALSVHVPWGMTIASSNSPSGYLEYIPTHSTAELKEALIFLAEVPEEKEDPEGSILVYENNIAVSLCGYDVLTGDLTLISHDNTFTFNTEYSAYYAKGTYTEEDGILTLRHNHGTTVLRREGTNLVVESGEPLCIAGRPFTLSEDLCEELPAGIHLPLYTRGLLYNGTYAYGEDASVMFDTENRTFTLTDADGTTWTGDFTLDSKFVNCNAGGKIFQFIPHGNQVRLNQQDIEKVVPVEEDFIFFDYAA